MAGVVRRPTGLPLRMLCSRAAELCCILLCIYTTCGILHWLPTCHLHLQNADLVAELIAKADARSSECSAAKLALAGAEMRLKVPAGSNSGVGGGRAACGGQG